MSDDTPRRRHRCAALTEAVQGDWGGAADSLSFNPRESRWEAWAGGTEYMSVVRYCPFCGVSLTRAEWWRRAQRLMGGTK
jgi:hypothetical protein